MDIYEAKASFQRKQENAGASSDAFDIQEQQSELIEVDEERLNALIDLCKQLYPNVPEYFIHGICVEQLMYEQGYENKELADELYMKAKEELKSTEYYIKVVENLSE